MDTSVFEHMYVTNTLYVEGLAAVTRPWLVQHVLVEHDLPVVVLAGRAGRHGGRLHTGPKAGSTWA